MELCSSVVFTSEFAGLNWLALPQVTAWSPFHQPFERLGYLFRVLNNPFERPMEPVCNSFGSHSFYLFNGKSLMYVFL